MDMNEIMQQAARMQEELARAQEEMKEQTFIAAAGGGMVQAIATGDGTIQSITIKPEVVDPDDVEMLQDLVLAAVNEALRGIAQQNEARMMSMTGGLAGGLNIPGLF